MAPIIEAENVVKHFPVKKSMFGKEAWLKAVGGVSLQVAENRVLGIVGESGSGKSTLARVLLALSRPTAGDVKFEGRSIFGFDRQQMKAFRRAVQIIFQDPFASLNPRITGFDTVSEPLRIYGLAGRGELRPKVAGILKSVGLG